MAKEYQEILPPALDLTRVYEALSSKGTHDAEEAEVYAALNRLILLDVSSKRRVRELREAALEQAMKKGEEGREAPLPAPAAKHQTMQRVG